MTTHSQNPPKAYWKKDKGRDLLILQNDLIRVTAWPAFGGALLSFEDCKTGIDALWHNPLLETLNPSLYSQPVEGCSDLYDYLDGSWFVSLPTGFFPIKYYGAPIGAHGELRAVPWEVTEINETASSLEVKIIGNSIRTPIRVERTWTLLPDSRSLFWHERIVNRSSKPRSVSWMHHPAFGGPLVEGGELRVSCRKTAIYAGFDPEQVQVVPGTEGEWPWVQETPKGGGQVRDCSKVAPAGSGKEHSIMLTEFDLGWGCLWNSALKLGFGLRWDETMLPWAWSWMEAGGLEDYPLWGQSHLVTLQPGTSPIGTFDDLLKSGQVREIPAGGSIETSFISGFLSDPDTPFDLTTTGINQQ